MRIGNPAKDLVVISERRGRFFATTPTMEISTASLRAARRLGVVLRRTIDRSS